MAGNIVHCVMGGGIVVAVYWRSDYAYMHARCVTGCDVEPIDMTLVAAPLRAIIMAEVRNDLPPEIREDMLVDWERDSDVTPVIEERGIFDVDIDALDDH